MVGKTIDIVAWLLFLLAMALFSSPLYMDVSHTVAVEFRFLAIVVSVFDLVLVIARGFYISHKKLSGQQILS